MKIRKGTSEDMGGVLKLIRELAVFEREPDAVVISETDLIRDGFGSNPLFEVYVAEHQGEIVGMALFYFRYSTWKGKTIHLEDLMVTESARGNGIGYLLYSEVIRRAKTENVRRVEWNVLEWNQPAIKFYERSGANVLEYWRVVHMDAQGIDNFIKRLDEGI